MKRLPILVCEFESDGAVGGADCVFIVFGFELSVYQLREIWRKVELLKPCADSLSSSCLF